MSFDPTIFRALPELVATQATRTPQRIALSDSVATIGYAEMMNRVDGLAAKLQMLGLLQGQRVALIAECSVDAVIALLAILRAGGVVVPLPLLAHADVQAAMLADSAARMVLKDASQITLAPDLVSLDISQAHAGKPDAVDISADSPFAIIYSSGTTGKPKGIVHTHRTRWDGVVAGHDLGLDDSAVVLIATPLYSNTTWVTLLPALALGASVVLQARFAAQDFLRLSEQHRVTHSILVPTQYARILAEPAFDAARLQSYRLKLCTGSHCATELKREVLQRWPGDFFEIYGLTEGGGVSLLSAREHPHKLHTVGKPLAGHEFRVIDEDGSELPAGRRGELVSRSPGPAAVYHHAEAATRHARWRDASGQVYLRTGDIGEFDSDGFLSIVGRHKDMIISGGFNIYPQDLEQVLLGHPAVLEAAVVGGASQRWGETPHAFLTLRASWIEPISSAALRDWANAQLGRNQRIAELRIIPVLPRNALGKVLKNELRALAQA